MFLETIRMFLETIRMSFSSHITLALIIIQLCPFLDLMNKQTPRHSCYIYIFYVNTNLIVFCVDHYFAIFQVYIPSRTAFVLAKQDG